VRLILMDVDGVMTDGRIHVSDQGHESRSFDVKDGHGIRMGQQASIEFAIISGRRSPLVEHRAAELGITEVHQRILDKSAQVSEILQRLDLSREMACFIGDDLIDIPAMRGVGLAVATADAVPQVLETAHFVTRRPGGRGAVREVVDMVLQAGGHWDEVTRRYYE
jgi:3-deoxy-D-manno-octulosonate 8-phosphate phosphatase (KDO 8-P phosphatase)